MWIFIVIIWYLIGAGSILYHVYNKVGELTIRDSLIGFTIGGLWGVVTLLICLWYNINIAKLLDKRIL